MLSFLILYPFPSLSLLRPSSVPDLFVSQSSHLLSPKKPPPPVSPYSLHSFCFDLTFPFFPFIVVFSICNIFSMAANNENRAFSSTSKSPEWNQATTSGGEIPQPLLPHQIKAFRQKIP